MLKKRVATAIVGIPLVVYLIHSGDVSFVAAIVFLAAVALWELNNMAGKKYASIYPLSAGAPAILLCIAAYSWKNEGVFLSLITLSLLLIMLEGICRHQNNNWFYCNLYSFYAVGYIGILFSHIILLRQFDAPVFFTTPVGNMPFGEAVLWLALIGTWASDTFAYFIGTAFGKTKLCPAISPAKSWEGAIGGFIGCIICVWAMGSYFFGVHQVNLWLFGLIVAIFAPLGDLAESQLKRFSGVKDSGSIFPGHGGVLDRLDSLLFVAPTVYIYLKFTLPTCL